MHHHHQRERLRARMAIRRTARLRRPSDAALAPSDRISARAADRSASGVCSPAATFAWSFSRCSIKAPSHGYEIIKALEEKSSGFYSPSPGVIYPTLTFLEEAGYVTAATEGNKKVYSITQAGRDYLAENRDTVDFGPRRHREARQEDRLGARMVRLVRPARRALAADRSRHSRRRRGDERSAAHAEDGHRRKARRLRGGAAPRRRHPSRSGRGDPRDRRRREAGG